MKKHRAFIAFAGLLALSAVGCAVAEPRVVVAPRPFHPLRPWVAVEPVPVVEWWVAHPSARTVWLYGSWVPEIEGLWSVTIADTMGQTASYSVRGATPYEAEGRAKEKFRAQFPNHGELRVTGVRWLSD